MSNTIKLLCVSLLVLIISSCSVSKRASKKSIKKQSTEKAANFYSSTADTERRQSRKSAKEIAQNERLAIRYQLKIERIWAKNQVFTERENLVISSYFSDFFANSETVKINLNRIASVAVFPFNGLYTSNYGFRGSRMHHGIDLSARNGARDIHAYMGGVVRVSTFLTGFGNTIVLRHFNGLETVYAHNRRNLVKRGDVVSSGDLIAIVGNTGYSTGAHLHFEIRVNGISVDPNYFMDPKSRKLKRGNVYLHKHSNSIIEASNTENKGHVIVKKYHIIMPGDTLSSLSRKYGISIHSLCNLNGIIPKSILKIGKQLRVA